MITLALLLQTLPVPLGDAHTVQTWGRFSRSLVLGGQVDEVTMTKARRPGERLIYRFILTQRANGAVARRSEATDETCPAMARVIASLARLRPPTFNEPMGFDPPAPPTVDGAFYTVSVHASRTRGDISWSSHGGSLEAWVNANLSALKSCWRSMDS